MFVDLTDDVVRQQLRGMFQSWYLDYASYTILDRAIPNIDDGLKPVQRRILHSMKTLDDGRFNKVANIVGNTMQYHPHGDASIYGALVQLGQKELLVETQGNWGNTLTGAPAAAGRYIEARLSQFALDVLYNPKVTQWTMSYDGRKKEPVTLPAKFPLLLAQGVSGIAAGLSSLILPHNFNEILDAAVAYLRGEPFTLYPDFATGGFIDVSRYNDGARGGKVRIRAKIEKLDSKTLAITEIPFSTTTESLIDSIIKAAEKGKIKIRKVDDNTAATAMILVHLQPGTSSDKTIDALYAFTDCELPISPNCCVIYDNKPHFVSISDVLRRSVDTTRSILGAELEIQLAEVREQLHFASLERIFIEERIYKDREFEQSASKEEAIAHIDRRLEPWKPKLLREVTTEDIERLFEIKMGRILKFNSAQAEENIAAYKERMAELSNTLARLTEHTIEWYLTLKEKYGEAHPRRTVIRNFENIAAATVAEANEKLYINREEGFIGTSLKRDEYLCTCSSIDDIIIFYKDGTYKVTRVQEKMSVGKNVLYVNVFKKDSRTIYNVIYQDGKGGPYYMKRFNITGVTRDRDYNVTQGTKGSKIVWFSANPNGEAEVVKVTLKPIPRLKRLFIDVNFSELAIKGRSARGNLVTRNEVHRFSLKEKGKSTLGGRKVWFDPDILRLNYDGRGNYLGEFGPDDLVLVVLDNGEYYTSTFDAANHYDDNILRIEKYRPKHVWTAIVMDADQQNYPYMKRFTFEPSVKKQRFIGENPKSKLMLLTEWFGARFEITFKEPDTFRGPLQVTASEFIAVKSFRAKGKRLTTYGIENIMEIDPVETEEPEEEVVIDEDAGSEPEVIDEDAGKSEEEVRDEILGQKRIF
ncbi:MAG: DNA gyrase/topoisomerase IV subunit A [Firmicutes bacterium]|nr:DNA gyrase/topoisomerase IV subunit A [Bacillota bacterium]MCM1400657.1 DNA gyrase/topoisomerase IV subunit A [Bacteroides sp.]MCM1476348.1 DNA gyrase/topoisomerase IV subunit A [Bacteroides sp.]